MRDYRLYQFYTREYGLTFLPKELDDEAWDVATELMIRALSKEGPAVSHALIKAGVLAHSSQERVCENTAIRGVA